MKCPLQFASLFLALLLAAEPALAGACCSTHMRHAQCPMGVEAMGPECPMMQQAAAIACTGDCCRRAEPQIVAPCAVPEKPKPVAVTPIVEWNNAPQLAAEPAGAEQVPAWSPPRYILNRVLRI